MDRIIFLAGLFPSSTRKEIEKNSKGVIQYAADALQWALVEGLDKHVENVKLINLPYIGSFPFRYKKSIIKYFSFSHKEGALDTNVGFLNFPVYKLFSRYYNAKKTLEKEIDGYSQIILIYAIHTPFIKAVVELKEKNPLLKICLIVPDLPEHMGGSNTVFYKALKNIENGLLDKLLVKIDAFVLLSDYMHEPLKVGSRPWVRVEGIFNSNDISVNQEKEKFKTILYTGTLAKRYGILNLLKAFSMIDDDNYRLWICGDGDAKEDLIQMAKDDSRINYLGQLSREIVLSLQKRATLLVNPRTSEGEFTKYSFPSKIMEYLASGTPCVMNALQGIPKEYLDFCFIPKAETPESLFETIIDVCNKKQSELILFGEKAKEFIYNHKSAEKQCEKIVTMLNILDNAKK